MAAEVKPKRKRGGQPGNLNAAKHLFYSSQFKSGELNDFEAMMSEGLESEISLMRVLIRRVMDMSKGVRDLDTAVNLLGAQGMAAIRLASLLKTQRMLLGDTGEVGEAISQALSEVIKELGVSQ